MVIYPRFYMNFSPVYFAGFIIIFAKSNQMLSYELTLLPLLAREAVNQMLRYKDKVADAYFVFIAPYISLKAAEICQSEGIGYLDLSGNCLLSFGEIFIQKKDYPNRFKEKRDLKSLYTPKAERLLRVLLCNPGKKWKIKELAVESSVSLGQASNVKKLLFDRSISHYEGHRIG
ncbi:MAG: hypothetical protein GY864_05600 [Desulfobacterales bacterium]|nr:hypothetical protein [Desulfobacterales bacterium]